jgi:hypothetical protein
MCRHLHDYRNTEYQCSYGESIELIKDCTECDLPQPLDMYEMTSQQKLSNTLTIEAWIDNGGSTEATAMVMTFVWSKKANTDTK